MSEVLEFRLDKFTFKVPTDRLYSSEGLWALEMDAKIRIGLSDYLQQHSGDIAFVDLQPSGKHVGAGELLFSIETIKVTLDLTTPLPGVISRLNPAMELSPEKINSDPYGEGWVCELDPADWEAARQNLLTPEAYFDKIQLDAAKELEEDAG